MVHKSSVKKHLTSKKVTVLIVPAICITLLLSLVFSTSCSWSDAGIFPQNLSFEMPDQEVQFIQKNFLSLTTIMYKFLIPFSLIEIGPFPLYRTPAQERDFLDKKSFLARC
jgi:hypothetical protein